MEIVDVLGDQALQEAARLPSRQDLMSSVGPRLAEVVVEDLLYHRPSLLGTTKKVLYLQRARVIAVPQAPGSPKGGTPLSTLIPAPVKAVR
jgi:hypothetical protein